tara:strand:- start:1326 stop:1727 length:402 start_codon:yes stop_codon:yes gene_type:complete
MRERIKKSLLPIAGKNLSVKENKASLERRRKKIFISLIDSLKDLNERSNFLSTDMGVDLHTFEDIHYILIENLIRDTWGDVASNVIFWWVYEVINPKYGDFFIVEEETGKKYRVKSSVQAYNILKKLKLFKPL